MPPAWNGKRLVAATARMLLAAQGGLWFVLAALLFARGPAPALTRVVLPILELASGAAFLLLVWLLPLRQAWLYYGACVFVALNGILAATDEVGTVDVAVLLLDAGTFALLLLARRCFLPPGGNETPKRRGTSPIPREARQPELSSAIRGLLLDVGHTLAYPISGNWFVPREFAELLGSRGLRALDPGDPELRRAIGVGLEYLDANHHAQTEADEEAEFREFYRIVLGELGHEPGDLPAALSRALVYDYGRMALYDDVRPSLANLSAGGFSLGVLSDTWPSLERIFAELGLRKLFDSFTISSRVGCHKPCEAIYLHALAQIDLAPEQALFVDDVPANLEGAAKLGVRTVLMDRLGKNRGHPGPRITGMEQLRACLD